MTHVLATCTKCKVEKELNLQNFPPHNKKKNGFDSWCRKCRGEYRSNIRRGLYRASISDEHLKKVLSETLDCVICGYVFEKEAEKQVDHDHRTNMIRGILCNNCNRGIGQFKDDPLLLEFARIYLLDSVNNSESVDYISKFYAEEC